MQLFPRKISGISGVKACLLMRKNKKEFLQSPRASHISSVKIEFSCVSSMRDQVSTLRGIIGIVYLFITPTHPFSVYAFVCVICVSVYLCL